MCIDFNPTNELIFLVGTEEGKIFKCSKAYKEQYLAVYEAHTMPVYTVQFSRFDSRLFLSCGADWMLKLFDDKDGTELLAFDLDCTVECAQFSPFYCRG